MNRLTAFRPAVLAIRWGTASVGLVLAIPGFDRGEPATIAGCALLFAYTTLRTLHPIAHRDSRAGLVPILAEVAVNAAVVASTGRWDSPFVFSLLTAVVVAGFARGFVFALEIGAVSALSVGTVDLLRPDHDLRVGVQWTVELLMVALVAGYARRISGEADLQQSLALDRLGRLSNANALLFSLHQLAQTLPASLDLREVLDQTMGRLHDLFDYEAAALLVYDDTDRTWTVARREGTRLPPALSNESLPPPLARSLSLRSYVSEPNLLVQGGPGLAPRMCSGMYAVLPVRGSIIGLVAVEHGEPFHFTQRDVELLNGFAEPAALAIDNARWFARLRTVGADEERTRIARDLHDRIGQSLAYIAFELDRIAKSENKGADVGAELDQLRSDVRGVIGEVRDTLYDLRTDVSDSLDLLTVLDQFIQRVRERTGLTITLRMEESGRLPILQEREVFRIAQEAITNIERHSEAQHVTVSWRCDGRTASLEIADDGRGFPTGTAGRLDSYGITGMRERAAGIGAELEVSSSPGVGTRVRCVVNPALRARRRRALRATVLPGASAAAD